MKRQVYLGILLSLLSISLEGQTDLYPGDIAFVGIQTDNPDDFSFVFQTSIQKNTVIYITDCGVMANGSFRKGEGGLKYTAPNDLPIGTLVNYIRDSSDFSKLNDPILGNRGFNLSSSGDQIIAFQDSSIHPRFLFAIQTNSSRWQNECTNTNVSCLPPGLIDATSAICLGKDTGMNNYWHNAALKNVPSGKNKTKTRTEICDRNNWAFSNSRIPMPSDNLILVPDSDRYIKVLQDSIFFMHDSLHFDIVESNIERLTIWLKTINSRDSFLIQNHWPSALKCFAVKFPMNSIRDSFQLLIGDADFPGFFYRSIPMIIKDTILLRFIEFKPNSIRPGDSITLIFNKELHRLRDSLILRNTTDKSDSIVLSFSSGTIRICSNKIVLQWRNLIAGKSYAIEINKGWISDKQGNLFTGFGRDSFPVFEVSRSISNDTIGPVIISIEPSLNEPIKLDQKIRFVFNEPLYSVDGAMTDPIVLENIINVQDIDGENFYDFIIEFDSLFTSFTILPIGLEEGKAYYISFFGFSDSIGNECEELIFTFEIEKITNSGRLNINKESLWAYPNPAENYLWIQSSNVGHVKIEIIDITGKTKYVRIIELANEKIIIDISALSSGTYFIIIDDKSKIKRGRFVKK